MNANNAKRVSYDIGCMKSLRKLPDRITAKFMDMMTRYMSDPSTKGLNLETVEGARDNSIKSLRVDQGYRAIAFEVGQDIMFVHVNEHDKAYRWASGRRVKLDPTANRIRVIEEIIPEVFEAPASAPEVPLLFSEVADKRLLALGVQSEELPAVRSVHSLDELEGSEERFDPMSFQILYGLAAGYSDEEVYSLTGIGSTTEAQPSGTTSEVTFENLIETEESRQTIFIPETEEELRRFFEGELEGWRVFLHPEQRKFAYRDYNGPAMVRGGAGTGKTVVAMHRAKHIADQIKDDPQRTGERVLFTTFTTSLAQDILANLRTLCPEHLSSSPPRIEVINLDRWVSQFLKRKKFERTVAYFGEERDRLDENWRDVFLDHDLPEGLSEDFVKTEWSQVVQAKGIQDQRSYFKVPRTGRGTPLDRKKRALLWDVFADYRARMISEGLAEPDDAYREATEILTSEAPNLSYAAVIVDEAQDMGEQAFRLIRAIVPENSDGDPNTIFIVGDAHQRIYARSASMSSCGINIRGRSRRLKLNYRTTHEIRAWGVSILEGVTVDDLDDGTDTLDGYISLFHGPRPELSNFSSDKDELFGLVKWVKKTEQLGTQLSDIGILVNTKASVDQVQDSLNASNIDAVTLKPNRGDDRSVPGVRITTMHRAKGLEFFAVALPFLGKSKFPPSGVMNSAVDPADLQDILNQHKSLLHVAATRAKKSLYVSWSGIPSDLIKDYALNT